MDKISRSCGVYNMLLGEMNTLFSTLNCNEGLLWMCLAFIHLFLPKMSLPTSDTYMGVHSCPDTAVVHLHFLQVPLRPSTPKFYQVTPNCFSCQLQTIPSRSRVNESFHCRLLHYPSDSVCFGLLRTVAEKHKSILSRLFSLCHLWVAHTSLTMVCVTEAPCWVLATWMIMPFSLLYSLIWFIYSIV